MKARLLEINSVTVGENTFYIRPLPAFKAANISGEVISLAMPLIAGLVPLAQEHGGNLNLDNAAPAIASGFGSISGDNIERLLKLLLIDGGNVAVDMEGYERAQVLTFDIANELFCENVEDMYVLAFEVLKRNYGGFFKKLGTRFGSLSEVTKNLMSK